MPLTGRGESYAPAMLAEKLLPIEPHSEAARTRLNRATHVALGLQWGVARVAVGRAGLALSAALGVYQPQAWSLEDTAVDAVDKLVQAEATSSIYEALQPAP